MGSKSVLTFGAAAIAAVTATAVGAGAAAAAPADTASSTFYTLATSGFCAGTFTASLGHYPGEVDLGGSGSLYGVAPCSLDVDYKFVSRADKHVTTFTRHLTGPGPISLPGADIVSPGKEGVYDVTITPRAPHVGGQTLTIDTTYRG